VKRIDLAMPENYDMLCLIDRSKSSDDSCICYNAKCNTNIEEYNPIICDAWNTPGYKDNAFLVKSISVDSFEVTAIEIEGSYICIKPAAGSIPLRLEGKGNRTKISEWPIQ
jgi:expansin (peptidoglycan-binding protein)